MYANKPGVLCGVQCSSELEGLVLSWNGKSFISLFIVIVQLRSSVGNTGTSAG